MTQKKIKLIVVKPYNSTKLNRSVEKNEVVETTQQRAKTLIEAGVCKKVEE